MKSLIHNLAGQQRRKQKRFADKVNVNVCRSLEEVEELIMAARKYLEDK